MSAPVISNFVASGTLGSPAIITFDIENTGSGIANVEIYLFTEAEEPIVTLSAVLTAKSGEVYSYKTFVPPLPLSTYNLVTPKLKYRIRATSNESYPYAEATATGIESFALNAPLAPSYTVLSSMPTTVYLGQTTGMQWIGSSALEYQINNSETTIASAFATELEVLDPTILGSTLAGFSAGAYQTTATTIAVSHFSEDLLNKPLMVEGQRIFAIGVQEATSYVVTSAGEYDSSSMNSYTVLTLSSPLTALILAGSKIHPVQTTLVHSAQLTRSSAGTENVLTITLSNGIEQLSNFCSLRGYETAWQSILPVRVEGLSSVLVDKTAESLSSTVSVVRSSRFADSDASLYVVTVLNTHVTGGDYTNLESSITCSALSVPVEASESLTHELEGGSDGLRKVSIVLSLLMAPDVTFAFAQSIKLYIENPDYGVVAIKSTKSTDALGETTVPEVVVSIVAKAADSYRILHTLAEAPSTSFIDLVKSRATGIGTARQTVALSTDIGSESTGYKTLIVQLKREANNSTSTLEVGIYYLKAEENRPVLFEVSD